MQLEQAKTLLEIYNKRLAEIKRSIIELAQSGENTLKLALEKKRIENIIKQIKKELKETTDEAIEESYQEGKNEQKTLIAALGIAVIGSEQKKTMQNIYYTHLSRITTIMSRKLATYVRTDFSDKKAVVHSLNRLIPPQSGIKPLNNIASTGILSSEVEKKRWQRLMKRLEQDFKNKDIFTVPYYNKAGDVVRHVKASTYAEMLARTLTANTYREAAQDSILEQFGEFGDLVEILGRSAVDCSECKPYEGQILSLTGKTKGYTTIDEAKANGLFHPNCIHSFAVTDRVIEIYKQNIPLGKFIETAAKNKQPLVNDYKVGGISNSIVSYLREQNIDVVSKEINITYRKVQHALRDTKNPLQKLSVEQLKRIDKIINQNNVYFDTKKKNIIYVAKLPDTEIKNGRNWIKIPVNLAYKKGKRNIVGTVSIIPDISITKSKEYKKID